MTEGHFAMVSEWMTNGNINQFLMAHRDANRFELVSSPFKLLAPPILIDKYSTSVVGGRCDGLDPHAPSGNDPRGSKRSMSSRAWVSPPC